MHQSFSVMSLNLRFGLADDGPNSWIHRRHAYAPLLTAFPRDFYAFQEANDFQVAFLSDLLPNHECIGQRPKAPDRWQSNVIFFNRRWRCVHHEHFYLSSTPHFPSRFQGSLWPRQCTLGVFQTECSSQLVVVNTHLDFSADVQIRSAKLIRKRLRRHCGKGPIVVMGDFNCAPDGACYTEFTTDRCDGRPIFCNAFKPPYVGTHHHFSGRTEGDAIDWILYRGKLRVTRACVITSRFAGRYPSDHYPLIADFLCDTSRTPR